MATPRELFFVTPRYWLVSGGMITRMAWGITTSRITNPPRSPSAAAASFCPAETAWIPLRTISAI